MDAVELFSQLADTSSEMKLVERIHERLVRARRARILAENIVRVAVPSGHMLDVGCGDGFIGSMIAARRPGLTVTGVEVQPRVNCAIPVLTFHGSSLPFADGSVDSVLLIDVLHHTADPAALLFECARVARTELILKDHIAESGLARSLLRLMDQIGNARHGVESPGKYLSRREWDLLFEKCGLRRSYYSESLGLYAWPATLIFDGDLHFICRLERARASTANA